jgi:hypothetical protein
LGIVTFTSVLVHPATADRVGFARRFQIRSLTVRAASQNPA